MFTKFSRQALTTDCPAVMRLLHLVDQDRERLNVVTASDLRAVIARNQVRALRTVHVEQCAPANG